MRNLSIQYYMLSNGLRKCNVFVQKSLHLYDDLIVQQDGMHKYCTVVFHVQAIIYIIKQ